MIKNLPALIPTFRLLTALAGRKSCLWYVYDEPTGFSRMAFPPLIGPSIYPCTTLTSELQQRVPYTHYSESSLIHPTQSQALAVGKSGTS